MKFGNFLFPDSRDPERDGQVIDETLREAMLSDDLGIDVVWLGEHHFDGICAYADPIGFGGALAIALKRAGLGFAVLQTSLHHPIRLAEQLAVLDNLTKGRLIVGLGRAAAPTTSTTIRATASTTTRPRIGLRRPKKSSSRPGPKAPSATRAGSGNWRCRYYGRAPTPSRTPR